MSASRVTGWGRTRPSLAHLRRVTGPDDVAAAFAGGERFIARGLGRSYGDPAQLSGGLVLDARGLDEVATIGDDGLVRVGGGVSFDQLLGQCVPRGWFVPVTPGTRQVTMGGAFAADVHGKNHHRDGSFAAHVREVRLATAQGERVLTPEGEPRLFWASAGALGLTGVVTSLTLQLAPIETDQLLVDTERYSDLDAVMAEMVEGDYRYHYSVAWVDCVTPGGRAILTRGRHARADEVDDPTLVAPRSGALSVPFVAPRGLLNRYSVRAFNELWFRAAPRREVARPHSLGAFFHPLDGVANWNRLYGPRGFVQYQFCVPDESADTVRDVIARLSASGVASFLAVLKRFGPANGAPLSFPLAGWTLALDLPLGAGPLAGLLDELDELVAGAGGRVYLAKDARLAPERLRQMYPRLEEFLEVKRELDPRGQLTSDLARRLEIVGR